MQIDLVGRIYSSISFGRVIRELGLALKELKCNVSLISTIDENIDNFYKKDPNINQLANIKPGNKLRIIYDFPVNFRYLCANQNIMIVSWETTAVPQKWIEPLNSLDQIWAISSFVSDIFISAGVNPSKIKILPMGVNLNVFNNTVQPYKYKTSKKFKFLHLGVAQLRKGTDVLLKAYFNEFNRKDDVALVVKTNRSGDVINWIKRLQRPDSPEIIYIYENVDDHQLAKYYKGVNCFVFPTKGEGAGLTILESMACGVPAITTAWGGQLDFCKPDNSFLLPCSIEPLQQAYSFYSTTGIDYWANIKEKDLRKMMRYTYENPDIVKQKGDKAAKFVENNHTWKHSAISALKNIYEIHPTKEITETIAEKQTKSSIIKPEIRLEETNTKHKLGIMGPIGFLDDSCLSTLELYKMFPESIVLTPQVATEISIDRQKKCWSFNADNYDDCLSCIKNNKIDTLIIVYKSHYFNANQLCGLAKRAKINVILLALSPYLDIAAEYKLGTLVNKIILPEHNNSWNKIKMVAKLHYLPNFSFNMKKIRGNLESLRRAIDLPLTSKILVYIGELNYSWKLDNVLQLTKVIDEKYSNTHLLYYNIGQYDNHCYRKLKNEIRQYGLDSNITIIRNIWPIDKVIKLLFAADIVISEFADYTKNNPIQSFLASFNKPYICRNAKDAPMEITDNFDKLLQLIPKPTTKLANLKTNIEQALLFNIVIPVNTKAIKLQIEKNKIISKDIVLDQPVELLEV